MENDIFFEVLKKCYNKGINNSVDITPEFRMAVNNISGSKPDNWRETPQMIFKDFKELDYIHYFTAIDYPPDKNEVPNNWIELINVSASIKPQGLLFYNSWNQSKIQERANRLGTWNIIATLVLALATLTITIFKTIFSANDRTIRKQEVQNHLKDTIKKEPLQQTHTQNPITYPTDSSHTHPPSSSGIGQKTSGK